MKSRLLCSLLLQLQVVFSWSNECVTFNTPTVPVHTIEQGETLTFQGIALPAHMVKLYITSTTDHFNCEPTNNLVWSSETCSNGNGEFTIYANNSSFLNLQSGTYYYWAYCPESTVCGNTGTGCCDWFYRTLIVEACTAPAVTPNAFSPSGTTANPISLQCSQVATATKYWFQVATNPSFSGGSVIVETQSALGPSWNVPSLASNTYYWRVAAGKCQPLAWTTWSNTLTFTIPATPCGKPVNYSPAGGSAVCTLTPILQWDNSGNCTQSQFELWLDDQSSFSSPIINQQQSSAYESFQIAPGLLSYGNTYFWKVKVNNGNGWSEFSTFTSFSVSDQSIQVTTPPLLYVGDSYEIEWSFCGVSGNVNIDYSINNGVQWNQIASSVNNSGAYMWDPIPSPPSQNCKIRVQAVNGNITGLSQLFVIQDTTTQENCLNLEPTGFLQLCADEFTDTTASGNVNINNLLFFSGDLKHNIYGTFDTIMISGNCEMYLENIPVLGHVSLYEDDFELNFSLKVKFKYPSPFGSKSKLAMMTLDIDSLELYNDALHGVGVYGKLLFPDALSFFDISLQKRTRLKLEVNNVRYTLENGLELLAQIELRNYWITHGVKLEYLKLGFNSVSEDTLGGIAKLFCPPMFPYILAHARLREGELEFIRLYLKNNKGWPLGQTGLAVDSLFGAIEDINNPPLLIKASSRIIPYAPLLSQVTSLSMLTNFVVDIEAHLGSSFQANGYLNLFNAPAADIGMYVTPGNCSVSGNFNFGGGILEGHSNFSVFKQDEELRVRGYLDAVFRKPNITSPDYIAVPLNALFPMNGQTLAITRNYFTNSYIAGYADINLNYCVPPFNWPCFLLPRIYYALNWDNGQLSPQYGTNYQVLPLDAQQIFGVNQKRMLANINDPLEKTMMTTSASLQVNHATESVVICAYGPGGVPDLKLTLGDSTIVKDTTGYLIPGFDYFHSPVNNFTALYLKNPKVGDYLIQSDLADSIRVIRANVPPFIVLDSFNMNGTLLTLHYVYSDPDDKNFLSVGLDHDMSGYDGMVIADSALIYQGHGSVSIDIENVPTGKYYVYGSVTDPTRHQCNAYCLKAVNIHKNNAPQQPGNLQVVASDDSTITLSWDLNNPRPLFAFLYYTDDSTEVTQNSTNILVGDTNQFTFNNFKPGCFYSFAVSVMDTLRTVLVNDTLSANNQSILSEPVSFFWKSNVLNNIPHFNNHKNRYHAYTGQLFSLQLDGWDADTSDTPAFILRSAPSGTSISQNGLFQINPGSDLIGYHEVRLGLTDGKDTTESSFLLLVLDSLRSIANLHTNKCLYVGYDDIGLIYVSDPDFLGTTDIIDSLSIAVYSESDINGISIYAYESTPSSNYFIARVLFDSIASSAEKIQVSKGDTIWFRYQDSHPVSERINFAYFTRFKASFKVADKYVCAGNTVQFINTSTGDGLTSYWSFADSTYSHVKHPSHVFVVTEGYDTLVLPVILTVTDFRGSTDMFIDTIYVKEGPPVIGLPADTLFCEGDTINLSISTLAGNVAYSWSTGDSISSLPVSESDTLYAMVRNSNLCWSIPFKVITTASPLPPKPVITLSDTNEFCQGGQVILSGPLGYNYLWSNGMQTQQLPIDTSVIITLKVIDQYLCISQPADTVMVKVWPTPSEPEISSSNGQVICEGDSTQLCAPDSIYLAHWVIPQSLEPCIWVSNTGSYGLWIEDLHRCISDTSDFILNVQSPPPVPIIVNTGSQVLCEGDSAKLIASSIGVGMYIWGRNGQAFDTTGLPEIYVKIQGDYQVNCYGTNGCLSDTSGTVFIQVNPSPPAPQINYIGPQHPCNGDSVILCGPPGYLYFWSNGITNQCQTFQFSTDSIFLVVKDPLNLCASNPSETVQLTFGYQPVVVLPPVISNCGSLFLNAGNTGCNYHWSTGDSLQVITVTQSGNYCVTVSSGYCLDSACSMATVYLVPSVQVSCTSGNYCDSVMLIASTMNCLSCIFAWSTGENSSAVVIDTTGFYSVTVTSVGGCTAQDGIFQEVFYAPPVPDFLCSTLTACDTVFIDCCHSGYHYLWNTGDTGQVLAVSVSGNYCLTISDPQSLCTSHNCVSALVNQSPPGSLPATVDSCFQAILSIPYQLGNHILWMTGDTSWNTLVTFSGQASALLWNADSSCTTFLESNVHIETKPVSDFRYEYIEPWYTLIVFFKDTSSPNTVGRLWKIGNVTVSDSLSFYYTFPFQDTTVLVTLIAENQCGLDSIVKSIVLPANISVPEIREDYTRFHVFPNPSSGFLTLEALSVKREVFRLSLWNVFGQLVSVQEVEFQSGLDSKAMNINNIPPQTYLLILENDYSRFLFRVIKL